VAPSRRPKGGATRYRRNWDTVSLEVLWSRARNTVSHERADLELALFQRPYYNDEIVLCLLSVVSECTSYCIVLEWLWCVCVCVCLCVCR